MAKLSMIHEHTKRVVYESKLFGAVVQVDYYPGRFTPEYEQKVEDLIRQMIQDQIIQRPDEETPGAPLSDAEAAAAAITGKPVPRAIINHTTQMLAGLLHWFDLEEDDGKVIPPTADNLVRVPYPLLYGIFKKIKEDMIEGNEESSKS